MFLDQNRSILKLKNNDKVIEIMAIVGPQDLKNRL